MFDCCTNIDKWSIIGIAIMLFCSIVMVYLVSSSLSQQILALAHELDTIHKKVNGILGIIGIVAEEGRDLLETERAKLAQTITPVAEELVVDEVKYVDEETKPVETQESSTSGPAISFEEVEATFEGVEELK